MIPFLFIATVILLVFGVSKSKKITFSILPIMLISIFFILSILSQNGTLYSDYAKVWSQLGAMQNGWNNAMYFASILLAYVMVYVISSGKVNSFDPQEHIILALSQNRQLITIFSIFCIIHATVHVSIIDIEKVIYVSNYLFLGSYEALDKANTFNVFIHSSYKLVGLLLFAILPISLFNRQHITTVALTLGASWYFFYEFSGHTRVPTLYTFTAAIVAMNLRMRGLALFLIVVGIYAYVNAIYGRSSANHGLGSIQNSIDYFRAVDFNFFSKVLSNIFEGVFVQGEAFYYENLSFNDTYKNLSLSPFPSFIDGFRDLRTSNEVRFARSVPMGATGEILIFGGIHFLIYWITVCVSYACVIRGEQSGYRIQYLIQFSIFLMASYLQFSYPIRSVFRYFLIVIFLHFIFNFYRYLKPKIQKRTTL